jgi:salicylate hydroxylase
MGGAVVTCAGGRVYAADVVLAADGTHSVAHALLGGGRLSGEGWAAYRATVTADALADGEAGDEVTAWMGPDAHFTRYPVRTGEAYEEVAVFRSHLYRLAGTVSPGGAGQAYTCQACHDEADSGEGWGGPEELDEAFSWADDPVRGAVKGLRDGRCWRMLERAPLPSWAVGRVALLGDAVHPMPAYLAQGACQAIEDATALATVLADCPGPRGAAEALAGYQERRALRAIRVSRARQVWESAPLPYQSDGLGSSDHGPSDRYAVSDWLYRPPR